MNSRTARASKKNLPPMIPAVMWSLAALTLSRKFAPILAFWSASTPRCSLRARTWTHNTMAEPKVASSAAKVAHGRV